MADPRQRTPQQLALARKAALWNERSAWDTHCSDIAEFLLPRAARFDTSGRNRNDPGAYNSIIDETGTLAHGVTAAGLMAGMTSPARPWFRVATPDPDLMEFAPVKQWTHRLQQLMLAIFSSSNTYRALHATYEQLVAFGTGASVVVDNFHNVLHHYPQVFGRFALGLDQWGNADTIVREITKTVGQLVEEFGRDACSQAVVNAWDRGNYDNAVDVVHIIEPRRDRDTTKRDARNMRWASRYLEAGRDSEVWLRDSGFREFPCIAARWIVDGDDTYASRWPAAIALGSIKQLQQEQLSKSEAIDYMVRPPLQAPVALQTGDGANMLPGGITYVDAVGPQNAIRTAFDVQLNLQHLSLDIADVRSRINQAFYVDLFKMIANDTRSNITAREIVERHEEKLLMLGPVLERLHNEMLKPLIDVTFAKIVRAGLLRGKLAPPQELQGQDLEVEFVSTLAQAQRAVGVQSVDRLIGTVASLSQIKPEVLDKLDGDQVVDAYADMLGVDPSLIVSDDQVAVIRKNRQAQQQAAQMAAMAAPAKDMAQAAQAASGVDQQALTNLFSGYAIPGVAQ